VPQLTADHEICLAEQLHTAKAHRSKALQAALPGAAILPELTPEAWLAERLRQVQREAVPSMNNMRGCNDLISANSAVGSSITFPPMRRQKDVCRRPDGGCHRPRGRTSLNQSALSGL